MTFAPKAWPEGLTEDERETLRDGLIFLAIHHEEQRKQFQKDASNDHFPPRVRKRCREIVAHHTEQLHQIGTLAAKCGRRNAWPRVEPEILFASGTLSVALAVNPHMSISGDQ